MIKIYDKPYQTDTELLQKLNNAYDQLIDRSDIGFKELGSRANQWESCQEIGKKLRQNFDKMAVIGIGGSSLGAQTILDAFQLASDKKVILFDNVDPEIVDWQLGELGPLDKVHWVVVSKSGGTMETLALADYASQFCTSKGVSFSKNSTVVTELKSSLLHDWAEENHVPIVEMPKDVGGRFSVLTPVGLLPAAFLGLDLMEMQKGVIWARENKDLVVELAAQFYTPVKEEKFVSMIWSYVDRLKTFGFWWQQLWAESLAKAENNNSKPGPKMSTPIACRGPNDQHSLLQQVVEGQRDKFLVFLTSTSLNAKGNKISGSMFKGMDLMNGKTLGELMNAEAEGTLKAVRENGTPCLGLGVDSLNEKSMAALFMIFQLKVGVLGEFLNINTYNQPGVELSKNITKKILRQE